MSKASRILRKSLLLFVALLALTVLLVILSRLTTPSATQREKVALMQLDELPDGSDAFGLLWTLDRDVPFDEIDSVVAADAAAVAAWPDVWGPEQRFSQEQEWRRDTYPDLSPSTEDRQQFCATDAEESCLAKVRAAPELVQEVLDRNAPLLARIRALRETDVLRYGMAPHLLSPIPGFSDGVLPMTAHALAFVQGNEGKAMAETCRDLATWRRLALNTDLLIGSMVGIAYAGRAYGRLLGEMLAEWPVDRPLPAACDAALAPVAPEDLRICNALRGEFRLQERLYDSTIVAGNDDSWWQRMVFRLAFDPESSVALAAEQIAPFCEIDRGGRPERTWPEGRREVLLRWVCVGNPVGCVLTGVANGSVYGDYADRMLDFEARLRQLSTLAWMRTQASSGTRTDSLIDTLPPELINTDQPVTLTPDGRALRVEMLDDRFGEWVDVPLPPALRTL